MPQVRGWLPGVDGRSPIGKTLCGTARAGVAAVERCGPTRSPHHLDPFPAACVLGVVVVRVAYRFSAVSAVSAVEPAEDFNRLLERRGLAAADMPAAVG